MNAPDPPTADPALAAAVRSFRLATAAFAGSLAPLELLLDGADALPAALATGFELLEVNAFGALPADLPRAATVKGPQPPGTRGRPAKAATKPAPTMPRALRTARIDRETPTLASRPPEAEAPVAERPQPGGPESLLPAPAVEAVRTVAGTALLERLAQAALEAVAPPTGDTGARRNAPRDTTRVGPARADARREPWPAWPAGADEARVPGADTARLVADVTTTLDGGARPNAVAQTVATERAGEPAAANGEPTETATGRSPSGEQSRRPRRVVAATPLATAAVPAVAAPSGPLAGRPVPTLLEQLADTARAAGLQAAPTETAAPAPPAAGSPAGAGTRELLLADAGATGGTSARDRPSPADRDAAAGRRVTDPAAAPAPQELAWLVNEALVEQARRHGVDLS